MLKLLAKLLPNSVSDMAFGDIVYAGKELYGRSSKAFVQGRIKKSVDGERYYLSLLMLPDAYAGPDGSLKNYLNLDLQTAIKFRAEIELCIAKLEDLEK